MLQGKELKNNATAGIVLSDHSLVLQRITRYSAGDYTCLVANSEGKTASNPVTLQIMCEFMYFDFSNFQQVNIPYTYIFLDAVMT